MKLAILFSLIFSVAHAEDLDKGFAARDSFIYHHPTCIMRIKKGNEEHRYLQEELATLLKKRGYKPQHLVDEAKLFHGENYLILEVASPKNKLWRDCVMTMKIKTAKGNVIKDSDKTLLSKNTKRALPRVTLKGKERCIRALRDLFIHLPLCKKEGP